MDETDGDFVKTRRVGLLTELSERRAQIQEIIDYSREATDKTLEDGVLSNLGYPDETVAILVLAMKENREDEGEITQFDVLLAGGLLDHLDTLGYEVRRKKGRK